MTRIEQVTERNWNLLEELFRGSPECSECWCMNHRSDPKSSTTGSVAKNALRGEIQAGRAYGLLAFVDDVPAGWCAVDAVKTQIGHDYYLETEGAGSSDAWMIHCLYVDPKHRGEGISKKLVEAAISVAKENGASTVLAFPVPEDSAGKFPKDVAEFSGRISTFRKLGFEPHERLNDFYQVVSKPLKSSILSKYTFRTGGFEMKPQFHLSIGVRSIETSIDFFVRAMKATIQHRDPSGYVNIIFFGTQITLKENGGIDPNLPDLHFGINLSLEEFDLLSKNVLEQEPKSVVMEPKVVDENTAMERKKMYVKCPTGYLIEIKGYK